MAKIHYHRKYETDEPTGQRYVTEFLFPTEKTGWTRDILVQLTSFTLNPDRHGQYAWLASHYEISDDLTGRKYEPLDWSDNAFRVCGESFGENFEEAVIASYARGFASLPEVSEERLAAIRARVAERARERR
jgi:hypothetical protein